MSRNNVFYELEIKKSLSSLNSFFSFVLVLGCIFLSTAVLAGDIKMYNNTPSAEEMGKILFSNDNENTKKTAVKTRSISFSKKKHTPHMQQAVIAKSVAKNPCDFSSAEEIANTEPKTRTISFSKKKTTPSMKQAAQEKLKTQDPCNSIVTKSIGLPIKFARNSSTIMNESLPFINELGKMLTMEKHRANNLLIEGHTDAAGNDDYNLKLSYKRANAVKQYLQRNYSISSSRLFVKGKGETEPLEGTNPTDAVNRRVQFYKAN